MQGRQLRLQECVVTSGDGRKLVEAPPPDERIVGVQGYHDRQAAHWRQAYHRHLPRPLAR